jgi:hypothetical protein
MRALRILVAGLVGIAAMLAVMFAAVVVFLTGLAAYILQLFGHKTSQAGGSPPNRMPPPRRTGEVIDVVTTKVPADPAGH